MFRCVCVRGRAARRGAARRSADADASIPMPVLVLDSIADIQDTAGQERFRTLTSSYYRGAQGVILGMLLLRCVAVTVRFRLALLQMYKDPDHSVYDVSSRTTFDELVRWFREIDTYCGDDIVKIIVGNKVDKVGGCGGVRQEGMRVSCAWLQQNV
jgi:hypothetical protein